MPHFESEQPPFLTLKEMRVKKGQVPSVNPGSPHEQKPKTETN